MHRTFFGAFPTRYAIAIGREWAWSYENLVEEWPNNMAFCPFQSAWYCVEMPCATITDISDNLIDTQTSFAVLSLLLHLTVKYESRKADIAFGHLNGIA